LNEEGKKMCVFSTDNWAYLSETVRDTAKVTINH